MMTCREIFDFLSAFLEGELPDDVGRAFEEHIRACPPCVHFMADFRQSIEISRVCCDTKDGGSPPEEAPEELIQAILRAKQQGGD